jgi:hypothetical protein
MNTDHTPTMDSNYTQSPDSPQNNSKFVNKIKKISATSMNYMTALHSETVIKGTYQPPLGKIRFAKDLKKVTHFCEGQ